MRLTLLLLALLLPGLLFACGGDDEYADTNSADTPTEPETPAEPPPPPTRELSQGAREALQAYHDVKAMRGSKEFADEAKKRAEELEAATIPEDGQLFLGLIWGFADQPEKAAAALKRFVDNCDTQTKNYETGIIQLIQTYEDISKTDEAATYVEKYIETYPQKLLDHAKLLYNLARAKMATGDFEEAAKLCERAVQNEYGTAAQAGVECLWAVGKYDEARQKADEWAGLLRGSPQETRAQEIAALAPKMGKKAAQIVVEGWGDPQKQYDAGDAEGEVTLVYFWNMSKRWAESLEKKLKRRLFDKYSDKGLHIVGLSKHLQYDLLTGKKNESFGTKEELEQLGNWDYNYKSAWPLGLCADDTIPNAYGYRDLLPHYAIVGKKGNLRFVFCDAALDTCDILESVIKRLLDE